MNRSWKAALLQEPRTDSVLIAKSVRFGSVVKAARGTAKRSRSGATVAAPRHAPTASAGGGPPADARRGPTTSISTGGSWAREPLASRARRGGTNRGGNDRVSGAVSR